MAIACPLCHHQFAEGAATCPVCGHVLSAFHFVVCPACGALNVPETRLCPYCQRELSPTPRDEPPRATSGAPNGPAPASDADAAPEPPTRPDAGGDSLPMARQQAGLGPLCEAMRDPLAGIAAPLALAHAVTQPHLAILSETSGAGDAERFDAELFSHIAHEPPSLSEGARRLRDQPNRRLSVWLRAALFMMILAAALVPLMMSPSEATPIQPRPAVLALAETVDALPEDARVLLIWGYDASYRGEMDPLVDALLPHLLQGGARLDIVALSPGSLGQARQVVSHTLADAEGVALLGYIPLGEAGWRLLVDGAEAALPGDGAQSPPAALSDYAQVLLLADNAATARGWAEQVEPYTGITPYVLVTARSEPALLPFLQTGQFQGLLGAAWAGPEYQIVRGLGRAAFPRAAGQAALALVIVLMAALAMLLGPGHSRARSDAE